MIKLSYESGKPIYEQIVEQMKYNIVKGYLQPGDLIPSVRKLALELQITPNTVAKAYQELERDGIIRMAPGKGTYIEKSPIETTPNEKPDLIRMNRVKNTLHSVLLELKMMGYDKADTIAMIGSMYDELD